MSETKNATGGTKGITRWDRLAPRLGLGGIIILGLLLFIGIERATGARMRMLREQLEGLRSRSMSQGTVMRERLAGLSSALLRFQLAGNERDREKFEQDAQAIRDRLDLKLTSPRNGAQEEIIHQIQSAFHEYWERTRELRGQPQRTIRRDTAAQIQEVIEKAASPLEPLLQDLIEMERNSASQAFSSLAASLGMTQSVFRLSILAWLVFVALAAGVVYGILIMPLRNRLGQSETVVERQEKLASLGVLAAGVAHEIRNPLTAIKCRLFSLKKGLPAEFRDNEDVSVIQNEINRLERIVKDFLLFARPSEPVMAQIQARSLLEEVQGLLRPQLAKMAIEMKLEGEDPAWLEGDKQQLQQVLINLAQNAAESIECNGVITLRARTGMANFSKKPSPAVIFEVVDTGKGIPRGVERRIFDPFYSTKEAGTGLGLPIAARIIEKHRGFIQYQTELNRGTTFSLVLPRIEHHASQPAAH